MLLPTKKKFGVLDLEADFDIMLFCRYYDNFDIDERKLFDNDGLIE
jgi:hypothetical protein